MTRKQQLDHERYMRNREERCAKQRAYYREHREKVIASVRECEQRRTERLREKLFRNEWTETSTRGW